MNWLDVLILWLLLLVIINGGRQRTLRALLDVVAVCGGIGLALLFYQGFARLLMKAFPDMWAYQFAFGLLAGGFALSITAPFDRLLHTDLRLSKQWLWLERPDVIVGAGVALLLSLVLIQVLALLLLTYPVLGLDRAVRGSVLIPQVYGRLPSAAALLPADFDAARSELHHLYAGPGASDREANPRHSSQQEKAAPIDAPVSMSVVDP